MSALNRVRLVLFCLLFLPLAAFSQQQAAPTPPPDQLPAASAPISEARDSNLVLDVVVTDRSGKPRAGLTQNDFVVRDNNQIRKILSFRAVDSAAPAEPVKIILLVDEVNTSFTRVAYERDQLKKFLLQNGGQLTHPVSLAFFSDTGTEMQSGSSRDGNALLADFDQHVTKLRTIRRSAGFYGAEERLDLSLKAIGMLAATESKEPGRKMVIWISPGWPILSGPNITLTAKEQQGLFSSIVYLSTALRQARITLYSIDPLGVADAATTRVFYYEEFLKPVSKPQDAQAGDLALQVLARQSGGQALNSSNDITQQITRCVAEADAFYTLTVEPVPSDRPNQSHVVAVSVETAGMTARTRSLYYGQP
ncbi:VWA domain-containing protein [Tunturibacter empetritectus]|uniref:VWFA-related protein n=1 Tax=Tunturiibacter empetritectus TaxID=3069691 RepID=A0A7W8IHU4_9BACT|nr:VWA domain-containing protein [Edaphobacter lichenicola]MBB5317424.1 VWFA-related protein [Edaphobacter lichenicola]